LTASGLPDWLFGAKFYKFGFFRGSWRQKNLFGFLIFGFFWRQLAHTIRLVFWLFKYLAEKYY